MFLILGWPRTPGPPPCAAGGPSAAEPHPGQPQAPRLSSVHTVELNFPFLPALPINAGIWWEVQNPLIIRVLLSKVEFSSPATAECTQSESLGCLRG